MGLIISKIFSVLVIIGIGYFANKINILPSEIEPHLNRMLFDIIIPGMLFTTITTREIDPELYHMTLITVLFTIVFIIFFLTVGAFLVKLLYRNDHKIEPGVHMVCFASFNTALIGFPIVNSLFGPDALFLLVLINLVYTIYTFVAMPIIMNFGLPKDPEAQSMTFGQKFMKAIKPILTIAPICVFIATGMLFMGLRFPAPIEECFSYIGSASTVISMLIVGIQLGRSNIREVFKKYKETLFFGIRVIVMPVICFFVISNLPLPTMVKVAFIFTASLPTGVTPAPLASANGHDPSPAAEGIVITCIISMLAMTVTAMVLSGYFHL